jgi:hypothetical protein
MKNPLVINAIRFILSQHGIDTSKPKSNKFLIGTQTRDYNKILNLQPFRFYLVNKHKLERNKQLVNKFQTFRGGLLYESLIYMEKNKELSFRATELYNLIDRKGKSNISHTKAIKKALNQNLIIRTGKGTRFEPYYYQITKEGINYIKTAKISKINHYNCLRANVVHSINSRCINNGS